MKVLQRLPRAVFLVIWAICALEWSTLTGDSLPLSALAALGAAGMVVVSADSAAKLGARRASATVAVAASLGPWLALFVPSMTVAAALITSACAVYLSLYLSVAVPRRQRRAGSTSFGSGGSSPASSE